MNDNDKVSIVRLLNNQHGGRGLCTENHVHGQSSITRADIVLSRDPGNSFSGYYLSSAAGTTDPTSPVVEATSLFEPLYGYCPNATLLLLSHNPVTQQNSYFRTLIMSWSASYWCCNWDTVIYASKKVKTWSDEIG